MQDYELARIFAVMTLRLLVRMMSLRLNFKAFLRACQFHGPIAVVTAEASYNRCLNAEWDFVLESGRELLITSLYLFHSFDVIGLKKVSACDAANIGSKM